MGGYSFTSRHFGGFEGGFSLELPGSLTSRDGLSAGEAGELLRKGRRQDGDKGPSQIRNRGRWFDPMPWLARLSVVTGQIDLISDLMLTNKLGPSGRSSEPLRYELILYTPCARSQVKSSVVATPVAVRVTLREVDV